MKKQPSRPNHVPPGRSISDFAYENVMSKDGTDEFLADYFERNLKKFDGQTGERLSPDKYGCESLFIEYFVNEQMEDDFPLIAHDFYLHEFSNLSEYENVEYLYTDRGIDEVGDVYIRFTLNMMMNAVNGGSEYANSLFIYLSMYIYENYILLEKFSKLITNGTIGLIEMKEIKDILMKHLDVGGFKNASKSIGNLSDNNLLEMIDEFETISVRGTKKRNLSLIETMLAQLINNADKISNKLHEKLQIYVDELSGYDDVFHELEIVCPNIGWARPSTSISQEDSRHSLMIQCADLLSGFVERCFRKTEQFSNDKECNTLWIKLIGLRDYFTSVGIIPWELYGTDELLSKISMLVGGEKLNKRTSYNCIKIEKYFINE